MPLLRPRTSPNKLQAADRNPSSLLPPVSSIPLFLAVFRVTPAHARLPSPRDPPHNFFLQLF